MTTERITIEIRSEDLARLLRHRAETVETFKPGDIVRNRGTGNRFILGHDGFFSLQKYDFTSYGKFDRKAFTSKSYERVEL